MTGYSDCLDNFEARTQRREELREQLINNCGQSLPFLKQTLEDVTGHWGEVDGVYRFYHQSWKVFRLQDQTKKIVQLLWDLLPNRGFHEWFTYIVNQGTTNFFHSGTHSFWRKKRMFFQQPGGCNLLKCCDQETGVWHHRKTVEIPYQGTNKNWLFETRCIVEAFFHAKYMLEQAIWVGENVDKMPDMLDSQLAALLHLYRLR